MQQAIVFNGHNAREICEAINPNIKLKPFALGGGVSLRQPSIDSIQLAIPARNGEVRLNVGDYAVQEDDGKWVRLSPSQYAEESQ